MSVNKKYDCSLCDYSAPYKSHLSRHSRMHTGERPFACRFPGCTSTFKCQSHLIRHVCIHTGQKSFSCPQNGCTASFIANSDLKSHLTLHSGEKPFTCNFCFRRFRHRGTLDGHIRRHTGEKPYKCQVKGCSYSCAKSSNLISHKRVHSAEKPFKCHVQNCRFSTAYKFSLKEHRMRHSGEKPFKCDFKNCQYSFVSSRDLHRHYRIHCGYKANKALIFRPIPNATQFPAKQQLNSSNQPHRIGTGTGTGTTVLQSGNFCSNGLTKQLEKSCGMNILTEDPKLKAPAFVVLTDVVRSKDYKFTEVFDVGQIMAIQGNVAKSKEVDPQNDQLAEEEEDNGEDWADAVLNVPQPQLIPQPRGESSLNKNSRQSNAQESQVEKKDAVSPKLIPENLLDQKQDVDSAERRRVFKFYTVVFRPVVLSEGFVRKVKFFCHLCSNQFNKEMQVLTHLRQHTGYDLP